MSPKRGQAVIVELTAEEVYALRAAPAINETYRHLMDKLDLAHNRVCPFPAEFWAVYDKIIKVTQADEHGLNGQAVALAFARPADTDRTLLAQMATKLLASVAAQISDEETAARSAVALARTVLAEIDRDPHA